ncbi:Peptidoglycan glycosyltransferase [Thermocrinis albus DSM 14484]|uniref:Peptidoglycan glycosyltransferase n=1 Tax=Thermocrinis albus (strain DSM 14484 / JCM 11386 / HI 11/12) TaxID=638303 RepID=D3SL52_THEAH|nr:Peptidoglycan glycosyltransferase [Thermocrinis albus DSM 14484]
MSPAKIKLVTFFLLLGFSVILFRAAYLQLIGRLDYVERIAEKFPKTVVVRIPVYRGSIKDRAGRDLALSYPTISIYAFPKVVRNKEDLARRLSAILNEKEDVLISKLNEDKKFVWLARNVDRSYKNYVREVIKDTGNSPAVGIEEGFTRVYPHGHLASNLMGFVGGDGRGLEGLEYALDSVLYSKPIKRIFVSASKGYTLALDTDDSPLNLKTSDVYTTLDLGIQGIAEDVRDQIVKDWNPRRVAILVMDVRTGDILALATYPYYDPNHYRDYPPQSRRNYAVTDLFEPGSVMKPFFIGTALDKGYIPYNYTLYAEMGKMEIFGRIVRDVHPYGTLTLDQVLIKSSNIGTIKVARFLSKKDVQELFRKLYFYDEFHVLPGEVRPRIPDLQYPANILYASIGQGIALNLLHLCAAFGVLATNQLVKPRILLTNDPPQILTSGVFSERTLRWLQKNLMRVVEEGTAKLARSQFFTIAGKTGTSQKFDFAIRRYSREKVVAYFVGYFPATNPLFVAGIMVDEPKGPNPYGGTAAAPYFKELVERVAFLKGLKPDKTGQ